ncbi:alpha/beta fold hydrolase [Alteriqipengyuania sp. 357]
MTTEHFQSFDGTGLALHRLGDRGARPLVLLHGLFSSAQMNWIKWGHAERIAQQGYEVLMLDFRVHGESEAPREAEKYPQGVLVKDAAALVDHLGLTDYDLAGFSLGARAAIHAVSSGVLRPRRLILGGMGIDGLGEWQKRAAFFIRVVEEFDAIPKGDPAYFSMQFLKSQKVDRTAARLLLGSMEDMDLTELANITCPTLVVCGDEDRDNGSARDLAERLPDATYVEVPGTHMSSVTKPDLGRAMAEWLGPAGA